MRRTRVYWMAGVLLLTALVFLPSLFLGFNPFWDLYYVQNNPFQRPLTPAVLRSAFASFLEGNYHPLTLLSHSLDYTAWSFIPFGHHLASYLLHLLNVLLVFLIVEKLGAGRSSRLAALAALVFGIHPLRVESVVWVTERKDLLFAFFYLAAVLSYLRSRPSASSTTPYSPLPTPSLLPGWYLLSLAFGVCSLLAKATAVSLPLALGLIDHDFLSGESGKSWRQSARRALPFAAPSALAALLAMHGQSRSLLMAPVTAGNLLRNLGELPALLSFYAARTLFPLHPAPIYPAGLIGSRPVVLAAAAGFLGLLAAALAFRRRHPVGLTLLVLTLVLILPNGGILRVGAQVLADRFSLLPMIPFAALLSAGLLAAGRRPFWGKAARAAFVLWIVFLAAQTLAYAALWDDAVALTRVAYDRYPDSPVIKEFLLGSYNNATFELIARGEYDEAEALFREALALDPAYPVVRRNLGLLRLRRGNPAAAADEFAAAIRSDPRLVEAYLDLARAEALMGKPSEAIAVLEEGARNNPSSAALRTALEQARGEGKSNVQRWR